MCLGLAKDPPLGKIHSWSFRLCGRGRMTLAARESPQRAEVLGFLPHIGKAQEHVGVQSTVRNQRSGEPEVRETMRWA